MGAPGTPQVREFLRQCGDSFLTTRVDTVVNGSRKNSMFLYPFVTACCGMGFMSVAGPRYDLDRFGCALPRFSPASVRLVEGGGDDYAPSGTHPEKALRPDGRTEMGGRLRCLHLLGGPCDNDATLQGIDTTLPVDGYIPGCPPRPEAVLDGLVTLQTRVQAEKVPADGRHQDLEDLVLPVVEKPIH